MKLDARISIHQGHGDFAAEPDWTGTIEDYWKANEGVTWGDICDMRRDLVDFGFHRIGGGAQACFTICTSAFAEAHKAEGRTNG